MKHCIQLVKDQPRQVHRILSDMLLHASLGRDEICRTNLSDAEVEWLDEHDFDYTYDKRINEWRIRI